MVVGTGCTGTGGQLLWNYLLPVVTSITEVRTINAAMTGPSIRGAVEYVSGGTLLSTFNAQIWLVSGPGPVYTNEILLAQLSGTVAAGVPAQGFHPLTSPMPVSGRPFNFQTDGFRAVINTGYSGVSEAVPLRIDFAACSAAATVQDCCAELNEKLDQLLIAVRAPFRNAP